MMHVSNTMVLICTYFDILQNLLWEKGISIIHTCVQNGFFRKEEKSQAFSLTFLR